MGSSQSAQDPEEETQSSGFHVLELHGHGACAVTIVILVVIAAACFYCCRRHRRRKPHSGGEVPPPICLPPTPLQHPFPFSPFAYPTLQFPAFPPALPSPTSRITDALELCDVRPSNNRRLQPTLSQDQRPPTAAADKDIDFLSE